MLAIVAQRRDGTNSLLAQCGEATVLSPSAALRILTPGDIALARIDVRRDFDGVEPGLSSLRRLALRGVAVLNSAESLLAAHDKLITALRLKEVGLPHPRTGYLPPTASASGIELPVVLKPRFGSWGRHVYLCESRPALRRKLRALRDEPWFRNRGAIVQEVVPPRGRDLRVLVAGGEVIGAVERIAAPGEWRTNIALGATRRPAEPSPRARALAISAAAALGGDLVGVDLLPHGRSYTILEVNGAVDFTPEYALDGGDVFELALDALRRLTLAQAA
jgi:RimK family alpha-L-glutamate ligase